MSTADDTVNAFVPGPRAALQELDEGRFPPQPLRGAPALGKVAGQPGEAEQLTPCVAHGGDGRVRPETRAVLADPPPLRGPVPQLRRALHPAAQDLDRQMRQQVGPRLWLLDDAISACSR